MNIHAKRFDKVVCSSLELRDSIDKSFFGKDVSKFLNVNQEYTVKKVLNSNIGYQVQLIEIPDKDFPCYLFEDVIDELKSTIKWREAKTKSFEGGKQNALLTDEVGEKPRPPMNQPVFTPPRSKKGWDLNVHIPQQTIDGHNAFDNHFTIIGIVTYTVLKQPNLKFNHFDWCQLHAINVSNRRKHGKWEEVTTYQILANRGDVNTIILAKLK
jgi:hypothetical protein